MNPPARQQQRLDAALTRAAELDFELDVEAFARLAGYSRGHFQRLFRRRLGMSPGRFLRHQRIERLAELLRAGRSVTDAAHAAGFGSSSRVHQAARDGLGMPPSRLAAGAAGELVVHGQAACRLGRVAVAATARGLCAVFLGEDPAALRTELRRRFPKARLEPGGKTFQSTIDRVVALIDHPAEPLAALPVDVRGTVFQRQVWAALRQIPPGATTTYGELARRIGRPNAARAVGSACGANPLAVIVPCHRAIAADGGPGGYRWGLERKRALLRAEREAAAAKP